jgi:hypothetical protein
VAIDSSDWDISTTGAMTGVSFDANGTGNSISNIESADILDGTITGDDIASSIAGAGLVFTAGSPDTIDVGAGNGISVTANAVAVAVAASADALSSSTSTGSGLEVLASGVAMLQGCSMSQILKWNETTDVWACAADATGGGGGSALSDATAATGDTSALDSDANTLNWNWDFTTAAVDSGINITESSASTSGTQDQQALLEITTLSGSTASPLQVTSTSTDVGDIFFNLASAGDLEIRDGGTAFATFSDAGAITFTPTASASFVVNQAAGSNTR